MFDPLIRVLVAVTGGMTAVIIMSFFGINLLSMLVLTGLALLISAIVKPLVNVSK